MTPITQKWLDKKKIVDITKEKYDPEKIKKFGVLRAGQVMPATQPPTKEGVHLLLIIEDGEQVDIYDVTSANEYGYWRQQTRNATKKRTFWLYSISKEALEKCIAP